MYWFDTHFHISPEKEPLATAMLAEARAVGVRLFLVQGTSLEDCPVAARIAQHEEGAMATAGLHPEAVETFTDLTPWRALLAAPKVVAVGEIGLDYHYGAETAALQRQVFAVFLRLAADTGLPAVIHCRDAFADCLELVKANLPAGHPFVIHSFTGTPAEASQWLELGAHISVNGMVTFKKADNIRESLAVIPLERLLLETDSPYLAPVPFRGHENTPANIPIIGEKVAELKGVSSEEVARITTGNGLRLFQPATSG